MSKVDKIVDAMITLNMTGKGVFERIKQDLLRGNEERAEEQLGFVDILIKTRKEERK